MANAPFSLCPGEGCPKFCCIVGLFIFRFEEPSSRLAFAISTLMRPPRAALPLARRA